MIYTGDISLGWLFLSVLVFLMVVLFSNKGNKDSKMGDDTIEVKKTPKVSILELTNGSPAVIEDSEKNAFEIYGKIDFNGDEVEVRTRNSNDKLENVEVAIKGNVIFITMCKDSKIESLTVNNPKFGSNGIIEADIDVKFGEEKSSNVNK